jgi:N-acylneuraminate cytidylyltransferase
MEGGTIAGDVMMPFLTEGYEGFDVNQPLDWRVAELLVQEGRVKLPDVPCPPYSA